MTEIEEAYLDPLMQTEISAVDASAQKGKRAPQNRETSSDAFEETPESVRGLVRNASHVSAVVSPLDMDTQGGADPISLADYSFDEVLLEQDLGFF